MKLCRNTLSLKTLDDELKSSYINCTKNKYYVCNVDNTSNTLLDIKKSNSTITGEKYLLNVLEKVNISLYGYTCINKSEKIFRKSSRYKYHNASNQSCGNLSCYYTTDPLLWFPSISACTTCNQTMSLVRAWLLFFILGITCLCGNGVVICQQIFSFSSYKNVNKKIKTYNVLVLSLSMADFLMGIYLVIISFDIKQKIEDINIYFSNCKLCNALGIIAFVSSQVSLSTIVLICYFRLHGVLRPYKRVRARFVLVFVFFIWIFWISIAFMPIVNVEPLKSFFNYGVRDNPQNMLNSSLFYRDYKMVFDKIKGQVKHNTELKNLLDAMHKYSSHEVLERAMRSFNMINPDVTTWSLMGFYSVNYFCTFSLIVPADGLKESSNFTLAIVVTNLFFCVIVITAYTIIYLSVTGLIARFFLLVLPNEARSRSKDISNVNQSEKRKNENHKLFCTITVIVLTDVILWLSMGIISIIYYKKFNIQSYDKLEYFLKVYTNFYEVMFCLTPINSVLNPFIYFHHFWSDSYKKLKKQIQQFCKK